MASECEAVSELVNYDDFFVLFDLYMRGDEVQKLSVIQSLPQLIKIHKSDVLMKILPKIQYDLPVSSCEIHVAASKVFVQLIELDPKIDLIETMIQGIEMKDPIICNAWIDALTNAIHCIPSIKVTKIIIPLAVKKASANNLICHRIASARFLGKVAVHADLNNLTVKMEVLPWVLNLCQDVAFEVRTTICNELPNIAKGLNGDRTVRTNIMPCIVEMAYDKNLSVRTAAINAVIKIIPFVSNDVIDETIIPLIQQLCIHCKETDDQTYPVIAKNYGLLLDNVGKRLSKVECVFLIEFFKELSMKGTVKNSNVDGDLSLNVTCRQFCAYNLPHVTYFVVSQSPQQLEKLWCLIFKNLVSDSCYMVRKAVASGIHETLLHLGANSKLIHNDLVKLLRDDSDDVIESLVPNISDSLECLKSGGLLSEKEVLQSTQEICKALMKCKSQIFNTFNWRLKQEFLNQLEYLPHCMPSEYIHQTFTPLMFSVLNESRTRPVKSQACRTILIYLRYNIQENERKWIREQLINLLCFSSSCYTRIIYVILIEHVLDIFSAKYFKENFYSNLIAFHDDPIATVRYSFVTLVPRIMLALNILEDKSSISHLNNILNRLASIEKDKNVSELVKNQLKGENAIAVKPEHLAEESKRVEFEKNLAEGTNKSLTRKSFVRQSSLISHKSIRDQHKLSKSIKPSNLPAKKISQTKLSDQHFFTDAGVSLPSLLSSNKSKDTKNLVISTENTNIDKLSEKDLTELETFTTNITDDVKANLKIKLKNKIETRSSNLNSNKDEKKNKRHSSILGSDCLKVRENVSNNNFNKRHSLHIVSTSSTELSRIPCFRGTNLKKYKSQSIELGKNTINSINKDSIESNKGNKSVVKDNETLKIKDLKENVPINDSFKDVPKSIQKEASKASNLPIFVQKRSIVTNTQKK